MLCTPHSPVSETETRRLSSELVYGLHKPPHQERHRLKVKRNEHLQSQVTSSSEGSVCDHPLNPFGD
jgi:hypothetical protein